MNTEVRSAKIYACRNATSSSRNIMNSVSATDPPTTMPRMNGGAVPNTKIKPSSTRMTKCPAVRSEEHTSELQSHLNLVCRLLLEKKKKKKVHVQLAEIKKTQQEN